MMMYLILFLLIANLAMLVCLYVSIIPKHSSNFNAVEHDINLLWNSVEALEYGGEDKIPEELQI